MATIRVTITIDETNLKRLRKIQSEMILQENRSISFSKALNIVLDTGLKKHGT